MTNQNGEDFVTPEEASAIIGVSRRTFDRYVDRYIPTGVISRYRSRRKVLYKRSDVIAMQRKMNEIVLDQPQKE